VIEGGGPRRKRIRRAAAKGRPLEIGVETGENGKQIGTASSRVRRSARSEVISSPDAVKVELGPKGRKSRVDKKFGSPTITRTA